MDIRKFVTRILLVVGLVGFVAGGLMRISFNIDLLKLLPTRLGTVTGLSLFARHFSKPTELIVTVDAPDADTAEQAVTALAASFKSKPELARQVVTESPWDSKPEQLSEFVAYLLINQPKEKFTESLERISGDRIETTLEETKETLADSFAANEIGMASYDPLGLMRSLDFGRFASASNLSEFSSSDGTFRIMYVEATPLQLRDYRVTIGWMNSVRACIAGTTLPANVKIGLTGEPAFVAEISAQMQKDMSHSGGLTIMIISVIFWACYRKLRPLLDLVGMLCLNFVLSLAAAGWALGELSMIGVGFASIMIGLSVDYGYMIYQASLTGVNARSLRRRVLPYVLWAATTTSAAFFSLNASSMPGLNQLGSLVGIGVLIGGVMMMSVFIPLLCNRRLGATEEPELGRILGKASTRRFGTWAVAGVVAVLIATLLTRGFPGFDSSSASLKMRHCDANDVIEHLYAKLTDNRDLISFIAVGQNESELLERLRSLDQKIKDAQDKGLLKSAVSPLMIFPDAEAQRANLNAARGILADRERLINAVAKAGFHEDAFSLTKAVFDYWDRWAQSAAFPIWPQNETSAWILQRVIGREAHGFVALGVLQPAPGAEEKLLALQGGNIHLVSWPLLGRELRRVIPRECAILFATLLGVLLVLLIIAFRSARDILLMVFTMVLVFVSMIGGMRLLGIDWNAFNVAAVMLLLGTGTDYSIYMILALNRNGGDVAQAQRSTGLVVFLCAGSAVAGFGTLAWAGHRGLASLGQVCALGLALDAFITVFLLPPAWRLCRNLQIRR